MILEVRNTKRAFQDTNTFPRACDDVTRFAAGCRVRGWTGVWFVFAAYYVENTNVRLKRFRWDEENEGHIAQHEVSPEEVAEACPIAPKVRRGRCGRYLVLGRTAGGRHLLVVLTYQGRDEARAITAREMDVRERRLYKRK